MQTETWTILRAGPSTERDRYGDPIPGAPLELPLAGCLFAVTSSAEPVEVGRAAVIIAGTLYAPAGADVRHDDQLRNPAGDVFAVDGYPAGWPGAGVVVSLKRTKG